MPVFERVEQWVARQPAGRWRTVRVRDAEKGPVTRKVLLAASTSLSTTGAQDATVPPVAASTAPTKGRDVVSLLKLLPGVHYENDVDAMGDSFGTTITGKNGRIHRLEDWGRRQLAYPISKVHKAHYVLLNIECDQKTLTELIGAFRFSDAVLRHLVTNVETALTEPSPMAKAEEEGELRRDRDDEMEDEPTAMGA